jgi:hypothetical protein
MGLERSGARRRRTRAMIALGVVLAFAVVGCRQKKVVDQKPNPNDPEEIAFVEDGTDATAAESDAQLLTSSLVSASSTGGVALASVDLSGGDLGTRDIGDGLHAIYLPRPCLTVSNDPETSTATYTFNRCLGPNGLRAVTGVVKAHYLIEPNHLHLDITADDLQVNEATIDWSASADIQSTDSNRTMTWKAQLSGTSAGGRSFRRNNEFTVKWTLGEPCFSLNGFAEGKIRKSTEDESREREIRTDISDFRRCRRGCPDAGGKITVTNVTKDKKVELLYDGTNQATFITPKGQSVVVPLFCKP